MRRIAPPVAALILAALLAVFSCSCSSSGTVPTPVTVTAGRLSEDPAPHAGTRVRVYASQIRPAGPRAWVVRWLQPGRPPILLRFRSDSPHPITGGAGYATGDCRGLCLSPLPDLDFAPPFVLVDGCGWSVE